MSNGTERDGLDEDWAALGESWRQDDGEVDLLPVVARIRRRRRRQRIVLAGEVGVALGALALAVVLMGEPWPANFVGITIALFAGLGLALAVWVHRGARQDEAVDVNSALSRAIRQARVAIRWAISGLVLAAASVGLLLVLGFAHGQPDYEPVVALPFAWKAAIAGLLIALQTIASVIALQRNRRYVHALERLRNRLFAPGTAEDRGSDRA